MNDLKFAFRQSLKHKGSSLLAVLILALGIGGTTAVFSVADKVLLNPIPGRSADRLITMGEVDVMHDGMKYETRLSRHAKGSRSLFNTS